MLAYEIDSSSSFAVNTAAQTSCPPPDQLAQLVTGSLIESEAERLFVHLDHCQPCQARIDNLSVQADDVIAAVRAVRSEATASEDAGLSRLISFAQQRPTADDTRATQKSTTQAVSAAEFIDGLRRSGLMADDELDQVLNDLSWDQSDKSIRNGDGSTLAKALIESRKLTTFQARLLLRGRWKGLVLGNYAILERLGQGGMGSVFKARHTRMGRIVCLKVVNSAGRQSPAIIERFRNEARALAALSHPNIVVAHDADESKGIPYLVMEFIDGDDLAKHVRGNQPFSAKDALEVATQTAEALQYAHSQGVVHRDVKPHNIVASRDPDTGAWTVKVLDLGLARFDSLITDNPDASVLAAMTNTGVVIGTVDYMAPEQALDSRHADARSDIYSLGCTVFFLLTGQSPFSGETVMQRLVAHREQPAPELVHLNGVSVDIEMVVHKMLAKNPEDRYQSMQEVLDELQLLRQGRIPNVAADVKAVAIADTNDLNLPKPPKVSAPLVKPPPPQAAGELSTLDAEFNANATLVEKPKTRKRRTKIIASNGLTAVALLGIAAAAVFAGPIWQRISPRVGGDRALRNGGGGRALVIVGSANFNEDQFMSLANTLASRKIDVVAASANYGTEKKDYGSKLKAPYENINLSRADATDFDAIFVIGGSCTELTDKSPDAEKEFHRIIDAALKNEIVVTGCVEGWNVIHDTGLTKKHEYKGTPKYKTQSAEELAGKADMIFNELVAKK